MISDSRFSPERLYALLPAIHRLRDAEGSGALAALVAILAEQAQVIEAEIDDLYENAFIETCAEWAVPYIAALLGARGLHPIPDATVRSQRAYVANTLAYRRRKGTATMLEQLTADVTGWPARAVEFFQKLATTQNINHRRLDVVLADLRDATALELIDGPFDPTIHTAGIRPLPDGRYNIPNVGLFVWRLRPYRLVRARAQPAGPRAGLFTFDPLGRDPMGRSLALWNRGRIETDIAHLAEEADVPGQLRRRALYDELEARRQALTDNAPVHYAFWDDRGGDAVAALDVYDGMQAIAVDAFSICDLEALPPPSPPPEDWQRPQNNVKYTQTGSDPAVVRTFPLRVAIDPELGRLSFRDDDVPARVYVSYAYAFPGDVGGGPYDRHREAKASDDFPPAEALEHPEKYGSVQHIPADAADVASAVANLPNGGVIVIDDSDTYALPAAIDLPDGDLIVQAAPFQRPLLRGDTVLKGSRGSRIAFSGVLVDGYVAVTGRLAALSLEHTTLVPGHGLDVQASGPEAAPLALRFLRSICGAVAVTALSATFSVRESILDGQGGPALVASSARLTLDGATVLGSVDVLTLVASNSIVTDDLTVARRQEGCVRYSWLTLESTTPRRYRCQPDLALAGLIGAAYAATKTRVTPAFTSVAYRDPAYTQLARDCPVELRTGGEDGTEMGVWNFLQSPQREANLHAALEEYLRFGLDAELISVT